MQKQNDFETACKNLTEEMGRYVFSAKNELDQVECTINTPGEWNIPLIKITGYVGSRYRISDID